MNSTLIKKCDTLIKNARNKTILYDDVVESINKNKALRSYSCSLPNAIDYITEAGIKVVEKIEDIEDDVTGPEADLQTTITDDDLDDILEEDLYSGIDEDELNDVDAQYEREKIKATYKNYLDGTGIYIERAALCKSRLLTKEEEIELCTAAQHGDVEARNKMVEFNLKLVISIAAKYKDVSALDYDDIIQAGNIGLMKAVDKFDVTAGNRFSTYATYWIKQSIIRTISNDCRTIRLPVHAGAQLTKNRQAKEALTDKLGRTPTDEELVDYINENKLLTSSITKMTVSTLRLLEIGGAKQVSLDTPILSDSNSSSDYSTLIDFIPDTSNLPEVNSTKEILKIELNRLLEEILLNGADNAVTAKSRKTQYDIICRRFGLHTGVPETLREIAADYSLTRERIRQLETKAMTRLRNSRKFVAIMREFL